jgi:hypothetical protein
MSTQPDACCNYEELPGKLSVRDHVTKLEQNQSRHMSMWHIIDSAHLAIQDATWSPHLLRPSVTNMEQPLGQQATSFVSLKNCNIENTDVQLKARDLRSGGRYA